MNNTENVNVVINVSADNSQKTVREMRKDMIALQQAMIQARDAGDNVKFDKLKAQLGTLKNDLKDTNIAMRYLDPDELIGGYIKIAQGVTGAFGAVTGAMSLFGAKSEMIQNIEKKSMQIIQTMMGLEQARQLLVDGGGIAMIKNLATTTAMMYKRIAAYITEALTIKTVENSSKAATAAQWLWNTAVAANPIMLLVAGVTVLGLGIYYLTTRQKENTIVLDQWYAKQLKINELVKSYNLNAAKEITDSRVLFTQIKATNITREHKASLIKQINDSYGKYLSNLLTEKSSSSDIAKAYNEVVESLKILNQVKIVSGQIDINNNEILNNLSGAAGYQNYILILKQYQQALKDNNTQKLTEIQNSPFYQEALEKSNSALSSNATSSENLTNRIKYLSGIETSHTKIVDKLTQSNDALILKQSKLTNEVNKGATAVKEKSKVDNKNLDDLSNSLKTIEELYNKVDNSINTNGMSQYRKEMAALEEDRKNIIRKMITELEKYDKKQNLSSEELIAYSELQNKVKDLELKVDKDFILKRNDIFKKYYDEVQKSLMTNNDAEIKETTNKYKELMEIIIDYKNFAYSTTVVDERGFKNTLDFDKFMADALGFNLKIEQLTKERDDKIKEITNRSFNEESKSMEVKFIKELELLEKYGKDETVKHKASKELRDIEMAKELKEFEGNEEAIAAIRAKYRQIDIDEEKAKTDKINSYRLEVTNSSMSTIIKLIDYISQAQSDASNKEIANIDAQIAKNDEKYNRLLANEHLTANQRTEIERKKAQETEKIEEKKRKAIKEANIKQAEMQLIQMQISIFQSILASSQMGYPAAIPFIALSAALGATETALAVEKIQELKKAKRGILVGPSHEQGGIKMELEGGEAVINKNSMSNPTFRSIASAINVAGGGVPFANIGGSNPLSASIDEASLKAIVNAVRAIPVVVTESDITQTQRKISVIEKRSILG